jgi:hypothetical protein
MYGGHVDINSLVQLRENVCVNGNDCLIEHHEDVQSSREQVWSSIIGCEYLAANPIFIPALKPILTAAITNEENFSVHNSPFALRSGTRSPSAARDPFLRFPKETIYQIVGHLDSHEIATLRLSSRAFEHLPISLWRHLIVREMPYLYEAWSLNPNPYRWATANASDLKERQEAEGEFHSQISYAREVIGQEMPELYDQWVKNEPEFVGRELEGREDFLEQSHATLPHEKTNWYQLYRDIVANWENLKGLQNRKRIWEDVMQILEMSKQICGDGS